MFSLCPEVKRSHKRERGGHTNAANAIGASANTRGEVKETSVRRKV
jgi:hypothetical protein